MSWATLERAVLHGARAAFKNPKLRRKDIIEWSSGDVETKDGEVAIHVPDPGITVVIAKEHDKR